MLMKFRDQAKLPKIFDCRYFIKIVYKRKLRASVPSTSLVRFVITHLKEKRESLSCTCKICDIL